MGLTDYAYGGDYGGTWVGTETAEQYALQYDADSRIATVYNGAHTNEGQQYYYDADSQLASTGSYTGYGGYGGQYTGSDQYGGGVTDYDANGNPDTSSADVIGAGNRLLSDGTYNYTYDLAGNMLSQTNISTGAAMYFGYDADNRMVSVVMKNGSDQETAAVGYTYDMYSDLIGRTVTGYSYSGGQQYSSTYSNSFVYDLATGQMVLEFSGGTLENRFLYGPAVDQILAQENVSSNPLYANTSWMMTNYQGSVVDELYQQDTAYGVDEFNHVAYNAFGAVTSGYAAQFGYDGTYTDPLTGLQLHGLRWYSTTAQRWTQPDPSGLGPDSDPYRYTDNDPVNGTDPTGLYGEFAVTDDGRMGEITHGPHKIDGGTYYFQQDDGTGHLHWYETSRRISVSVASGLGKTQLAWDIDTATPVNDIKEDELNNGPIFAASQGVLAVRDWAVSMLSPALDEAVKDKKAGVPDGQIAVRVAATAAATALVGAAVNKVARLFGLAAEEVEQEVAAAATGGGSTDGFNSFDALKRALGPAGEGKVWHHVVEQSQIGRFGAKAIHNAENVVALPIDANIRLNALYSSIRPAITGSSTLTVRQWLSSKTFAEAREFGSKAVQNVQSGVWP